jgi:hypothetical protein
MKILIIDSQNRTEFIYAQESWNGEKLKKVIKDKYQLQDDDMELVFNGNILEDNEALSTYDVEEGAIIIYCGAFIAGILY